MPHACQACPRTRQDSPTRPRASCRKPQSPPSARSWPPARRPSRGGAASAGHWRTATATITITGKKASVTITPLSFPRDGTTTAAYAWTFTITGIHIGAGLVLFETGKDTGYLTSSDLGTPGTNGGDNGHTHPGIHRPTETLKQQVVEILFQVGAGQRQSEYPW